MKTSTLFILLLSLSLHAQNDDIMQRAQKYSEKHLGRSSLDIIFGSGIKLDVFQIYGESDKYSTKYKNLPALSPYFELGLISIHKTFPVDIYATSSLGKTLLRMPNVNRDSIYKYRAYTNSNTLGIKAKLGNYKKDPHDELCNYFTLGASASYNINFGEKEKYFKYFDPRTPRWLTPYAVRANLVNGYYELFGKKIKSTDKSIFVDNNISIAGSIGYEIQYGMFLGHFEFSVGKYLMNENGEKLIDLTSANSLFKDENIRTTDLFFNVKFQASGLLELIHYKKAAEERNHNY